MENWFYPSLCGHDELLFQDTHEERFFLIDGDSLLLEASSSQLWQVGQQYHLFYLIELNLKQLRDCGGVFQIVFFQDSNHFWNNSPLIQLYRASLIIHLKNQCHLRVHSEWTSFLDSSFQEFLENEKPNFFCLHSGSTPHRNYLTAAQNIMAFAVLGFEIPLVYNDSIYLNKANLYGTHIAISRKTKDSWKQHQNSLARMYEDCLSEQQKLNAAHLKEQNKNESGQEIPESVASSDVAISENPCLKSTQNTSKGVEFDFDQNCNTASHSNSDSDLCNPVNCNKNTLQDGSANNIVQDCNELKQENVGDVQKKLKSFQDVMDKKCMMRELLQLCIFKLDNRQKTLDRLNRWCLYFAVMSHENPSMRLSFAPQRKTLKNEEELNLLAHCLNNVIFDMNVQQVEFHSSLTCDVIDAAVFDKVHESNIFNITECNAPVKDVYLDLLSTSGGDVDALFEFSIENPSTDKDCDGIFSTRFDNPLITSIAAELNYGDKCPTKVFDSENSFQNYKEENHWHICKHLKDIDEPQEHAIPNNLECKKRQLRDRQKYNEFMKNYGLRLNGDNEPKTIVTQKGTYPSKKSIKQVTSHSLNDKDKLKSSKKHSSTKSKKELIIETQKNLKQAEEMKKLKEKWKSVKPRLLSSGSHKEKLEELRIINQLDENIQNQESHQMLLAVLYERWEESQNVNDAIDLVQELKKYTSIQNKTEENRSLLKDVVKIYLKLGFVEVGNQLYEKFFPGRHVPSVKATKTFGMSYANLQLLHMGPLMPRNERSDPDPRVTGFIPDTWQRELLDVIDNRESALVIAPTSSGKTFCSYYCIEKILRESNDGIIVYVAPTKALVNQVSATIFGKYAKNLPDGQSLVGTFTRDYKQNADHCQVLVTVPQCMELLLLSPKRQSWVEKVQYVILDEVHCLGGEIGGEVWEHIIMMIPCPFLALSATVGQPDLFYHWLQQIAVFKNNLNQNISTKVNFILHDERYSDIEMSVFMDKDKALQVVHPCGFLCPTLFSKVGFPEGMKLSPSEAVSLLDAARRSLHPRSSSQLSSFEPDAFFQSTDIRKLDARTYERKLKETIETIIQEQDLTTRQTIASELIGCISRNHDAYNCMKLEETELNEAFPSLIEKMRNENKLPAIVFRCNRNHIEKLAWELWKSIDAKLRDDEIIQALLQKKANLEAHVKDIKHQARDRKGKGNNEDSNQTESEHDVMVDYQKCLLDIERRKSKFIFVDPGNSGDNFVQSLIAKASDDMQTLLQYGIGYHHSGCSTKNRQAVEALFRMGKIKVVIATSTLALGIHMPCKAVVLVGHDYYVDALAYRQMSGRSGRRGFDNLGHVVFFGVPYRDISNFMEAKLTQLRGRHPITITFVLRLLLLLDGSKNKNQAIEKVSTVLHNSFLGFDSPTNTKQLKLYFLFCCDLLHELNLINWKGMPLGYAGLVTHLFYHEPGNIFLMKFLEEGLFVSLCHSVAHKDSKNISEHLSKIDDYSDYECRICRMNLLLTKRYECLLCKEYFLCKRCYSGNACHQRGRLMHEKKEYHEKEPWLQQIYTEQSLRDLVLVLCHLFCYERISVSRLCIGDKVELKQKPTHGSKVILEPLPDEFEKSSRTLNQKVMEINLNFLKTVSLEEPQDISLPFSKTNCSQTVTKTQASGILEVARLSGCDNTNLVDTNLDEKEFQRLLPNTLCITADLLPRLSTTVKNSYALDFFKHGSKAALLTDNQIRHGDIYNLLHDFMLTICTIATALEQIPGQEVADAFKHLAIVYKLRFRKVFPYASVKGW